MGEVVYLEDESKFDHYYKCECGSWTFFHVKEYGLVCTECDGYMKDIEVKEVSDGN